MQRATKSQLLYQLSYRGNQERVILRQRALLSISVSLSDAWEQVNISIMKVSCVLALLAATTLTVSAQTTRQALGRLERQGVVSMKPLPPPGAGPAPVHPAATPAKAVAQAPAIEADLKPSPITLFGKIDGLSGTLYVTNIGARTVAPFVQLAVVDKSGKTVGWVTNGAPAIEPKHTAKIQVLATNASAVDFKIVRLLGRK
jgi:hypothetical protein